MTEKSLATPHRKTDLPSKDVCSLLRCPKILQLFFIHAYEEILVDTLKSGQLGYNE